MARNFYVVITLFFLFACDSENANNCFQTAGSLVQKEVIVDDFDKILVNRDIELIIKEGELQKVIIETGENLLNDIEVSVENSQIILTDNNTCNYFRDYGITTIYITAPNITEIRSSTQYPIQSDGVLTYPSLSILSEDFNAPDTFTVGDFILEIENNSFNALFNGLSSTKITGSTTNLNINMASGDARFNARNLVAQKVNVFNRGSNDVIVNPQESITGKIVSTGNVISVNRPPVVEVEALYKGRLIFE